MKIEGVIFDFNGTMFFDEKFQEKAWRTFLENKTGRAISNEEFQEYVHGRNAEITLSYFLQRDLSREEIAALEEEKEVVYRNLCLNSPTEFKLADGLPQFLDELAVRNIAVTIATASAWNNVRFFFENFRLDRWFDLDKVVYNDGTIPGKPEPDIYLKAAKKLNINMENCAVFEDAKSGVESARRAGVGKIVGVASMLDETSLLSLGAWTAIQNYCNVETLCGNIFA